MELTLTAADGQRLGATIFGSSEKSILVMPATGVPQSYYARFAAYLAGRGFSVLTFDYRGIGRSLHTSVRDVKATMRDWATLDAAAAFSFLSQPRVFVIGHSFGGQALGLLPDPARVAGAVTVGSQSGYWRNWSLLGRAWMWPAVHVGLPLVSRLHGYFPGSRLGFGEDLPAGVAIEWARWCRNPRYLVGDLGVEDAYARFRAPLRAYAISDDPFAPRRAVDALGKLYPNSQWETRPVAPRELGVKSIGHFGFFRERFRDSLWRETADWLESR